MQGDTSSAFIRSRSAGLNKHKITIPGIKHIFTFIFVHTAQFLRKRLVVSSHKFSVASTRQLGRTLRLIVLIKKGLNAVKGVDPLRMLFGRL